MSSYDYPVDSPLDNNSPGLAPETPSLETLLDYATQNALLMMNKAMPARVVAKSGDQTADIQLLPRTRYATDTGTVPKPILQSVPVAMPMGKNWSIRVPFAVGDLGYAIILDRNAEGYFAGDGSTTYSPNDTRLHDLADAIFVPGLCTRSQQTQEGSDNTDLVLTNGSMQVRMTQDGRVQLTNGGQELLSLIDQLLTVLQTQFFVLTLIGPEPPIASSLAAIQQIQTDLAMLRGES